MLVPNPFARLWRPEPVPPAFAKGEEIPEKKASPLSRLVFHWLTPILWVGYTRPLEVEDLWALPERHLSHNMADRLGNAFYSRCPENLRPPAWQEIPVSSQGPSDLGQKTSEKLEKHTRKASSWASPALGSSPVSSPSAKPRRGKWLQDIISRRPRIKQATNTSSNIDNMSQATPNPNFTRIFLGALFSTLRWRWVLSGMLQFIGDTLKTTSPLVNKALLTWLTESYLYHRFGTLSGESPPRGIGYGIGLAVGLFAMQEVSSIATNQSQVLAMANGMTIRSGLISLMFRKSLRLSARARSKHSTGQITTLISTDAARLDAASALVHNLWINPIQIIIGIGLLIGNLGYSGLVGLGVLIIAFPIQGIFVFIMFKQRDKGVKITDQRVRITTEVLQGIRLIKLYAWETFYADKIAALRQREIQTIRTISLSLAGLISIVTVVPIVASVMSFVTYALTGHALNPAVIFTALQFLNILRMPLVLLPFVFSACSDAYVALRRIGEYLTADELGVPYAVEPDSKLAIRIKGDFEWEPPEMAEKGASDKDNGPGDKSSNKPKEASNNRTGRKRKETEVLPMTASSEAANEEMPPEKPFELRDLNVEIAKGSFVAIVGRVGSGKSSLLQAMIGEMRKTRGEVTFGGDVAYVPQNAWIMNATLRDNVLFGSEDDEAKFQETVRACSLSHDLKVLPHGEMTEIGEKGINLSGGQKARVSLARAVYSESEIVLLDDPLSAVDAHVGKELLDHCLLQGPLADKARVLVTHALHVLPHTDYVYVMENGIIAEEGTYQDLIIRGQAFARLVDEFGSQEKSLEDAKTREVQEKVIGPEGKLLQSAEGRAALMQKEERNVGQVEAVTYAKYLKAAGGLSWAPFLILLLILAQAAQVANTLFLGFWTSRSIPGFQQGDYIGIYAALGVAQGIFAFAGCFAFSLACLQAGLRLFMAAFRGVIRSPISFFDTTPMGRVLSRLSKDQDVVDTQLSFVVYHLLSTFSSVLGTIALVFYTFPLLGIIFAPLSALYWACATFYRRSSVETKRLDSLLRSALYSSYSETLTGLSTVRAYREQNRFITTSEQAVDVENRAYYMTITIQRWLAVRLDLLGNILIFGIALFAAGFRNTVDPSKIGVVLTYSLSITQVFSEMVTMFAQTEQDMNSVERIIVYGELPSENDAATPNDPPPSWPSQGALAFQDASLAYREGLPLVLKGVSFEIKPGEKVGIVGRTGAGKSSLLQALFRIVELNQGSITIDGIDCRSIGLDVLRQRLAVIPQESVLFLGTLRENLDPQRSRTDADLIAALRRSWLLPQVGAPDPIAEAKFSLDAVVGDEGSNFSAGERQLLALCRALVKNSKIIVLDEATSNVDVETDSKLQTTIQTEFSSSTLLCIAHRLNTIVYYDRVIVMDAGKVAEFDSPLNLFDRPDSIFRSLCDEANLSRQDIVKIRGAVSKESSASRAQFPL